MISGLLDSGSMPTLERFVQFTGERHRVLTNNIANLDTPFFKPTDLDPEDFQAELASAIEKRRGQANPSCGKLRLSDTGQIEFKEDGMEVRSEAMNANILFHDQNNRDVEVTMKNLAENTIAHKAGIQLLSNQFSMLKMAIRGQVG